MFFTLRRTVSTLLAVCIMAALICIMPFSAAAADQYLASCVDLSTANQNMSGTGYSWANRSGTLTLTNLKIKTTDEYGLRIPKNATLVLVGDNYVEASSIAVTALLSLSIQGSGSLTLVAGDTGLKMISPDKTAALRIIEGSITIRAGKTGIRSDYPPVAIGNTAKLQINISEEDGQAVLADILQLNSGALTADAKLSASSYIKIGACALQVTSRKGAAINAPEININKDVPMKTGGDQSSLGQAESYNGEACIVLEPKAYVKKSVILGDKYAAFWDYIILIGTAVLLIAAVALPIIFRLRKNRKKKEEIEARRAAEKAARKKSS